MSYLTPLSPDTVFLTQLAKNPTSFLPVFVINCMLILIILIVMKLKNLQEI